MNEDYINVLYSDFADDIGGDLEAFKSAMSDVNYAKQFYADHAADLGGDEQLFLSTVGLSAPVEEPEVQQPTLTVPESFRNDEARYDVFAGQADWMNVGTSQENQAAAQQQRTEDFEKSIESAIISTEDGVARTKYVEPMMEVDGQVMPATDEIINSARQMQMGLYDPKGQMTNQEAIQLAVENPNMQGHVQWAKLSYNKKLKDQQDLADKITNAFDGKYTDAEGNLVVDESKALKMGAEQGGYSYDQYNQFVSLGMEEMTKTGNDDRIFQLEEVLGLPHDPSARSVSYDQLGTGDVEDVYDLNILYDERQKRRDDYINKAFANEDGKTPGAQNIFDVYNMHRQEQANDVLLQTAESNVDESLQGEEREQAVNDYLNKSLLDRAVSYVDGKYGKDKTEDLKNAKTVEEQNAVLRKILDDDNAHIWYDPETGMPTDPDLLSQEQRRLQLNKAVEETRKFAFMPYDARTEVLKSKENKVAALAQDLLNMDIKELSASQGVLQSINEQFGMSINPVLSAAIDPLKLQDDIKTLEQMAATGEVPPLVSTIPNNGNLLRSKKHLIEEYNNAVRDLQTIRIAAGLNLNPMSLERQGFWSKAGSQLIDDLGFETPLSTNKFINDFGYNILVDELGYDLTQKQVSTIGDRGVYAMGAMERIGETIPALGLMSLEMMATYALTGGAGNVMRMATAIGDVTAFNIARAGLNPRVAKVVGDFTRGVLYESYGLAGSNVIGGTLRGSDPMPVVPFAVGSQLGHLGINWASKTIPQAIFKEAVTNRSLNTVVNFLDKYGSRTIGGAIKFGTRPLVGATAIKAGEFTSGVADIAAEELGYGEAEMNMQELWDHITDEKSFFDTYGALLFMNMARPDAFSKKAVENFQYDIDNIRGNQPQWNRLARTLDLPTKKTGGWNRLDVDNALRNKINEIKESGLDVEAQDAAIADLKFNANRLKLKNALEQVRKQGFSGKEGTSPENWNMLYNRVQSTMRSLAAGNEVQAQDITNIAEAGVANGGTSPILELQYLGYTPESANNFYKSAQTAHNEGKIFFPNSESRGYKSYVENSIKAINANQQIRVLKEQLKEGQIGQAAYDSRVNRLKGEIEKAGDVQRELIYEAEGDRQNRLDQTRKYAEEVIGEGGEVKEVKADEFIRLKKELGGNESVGTVGYGFQTVVDGKTTFVINTDAMRDAALGSTLKHELFHPVFERKFSPEAIKNRAEQIRNEKGINYFDAKRQAEKEAFDYIDQFKQRLKEAGIYNIVEAEMKARPGYARSLKSGKRNIQEEKEFINEFLELQNEGAFEGITKGINFKGVGKEVLELGNGADVVDFFMTGAEKTTEGKEAVRKAQEEFKELETKEGRIQTSEKTEDINELALAYETKGGNELWKNFGADEAIKQIKKDGMLDRLIASKSKDFKGAPKGFIDKVYSELVSHIRNYKPERQNESGLFGWINSQIKNKATAVYNREYKKSELEQKTKRISDKISKEGDREFDVKSEDLTPEETMISTETEVTTPETTKRLISTFENPKANRKQKEILEVFDEVRTDPVELGNRRQKGLVGTPKQELTKVAELLFDMPGENITNTSKSVYPIVNIVDPSTGKKLSAKEIKAGKKGIYESPTYDKIRQYFKTDADLKRYLKTMPEYSVLGGNESVISNQFESIGVSKDILGRGMRLPDRFYDYFFEDFVNSPKVPGYNPELIQTSPKGRSQNKKSQPYVKRLKPEFRGTISDATIKKLKKDLLIGESLETYDRTTHGQLGKGMALVETYKVANEATRKGLPTETEVQKQLFADLKAGSGRLAMSEKSIRDRNKKYGRKSILDEVMKENTITRIKEFGYGDALESAGNAFELLLLSSIWSNAGSFVNRAARKKFPMVGDYMKKLKAQTDLRAKQGYKNPRKVAIEDLSLTRDALDAGITMELGTFKKEIQNIIKSNPEKYNKYTPEQLDLMKRVLAAEKTSNLDKNLKELDEINEGKDLLMDMFRDMLKDRSNIDMVSYMLYHPNSNSHPLRNFATMLGKEFGQEFNYEEHTLPFNEFTDVMIEAMTKSEPIYKGFKQWAKDNYFQESISKGNPDAGIYRTKEILDSPYRSLSKDGKELPKWWSARQMHPLLKQHIQEALNGKRKWSDVVSADIRKYNEYASDRGYVNPNKLNRLGETDAQRYNVEVPKKYENNPDVIEFQNKLIYERLIAEAEGKAKSPEYYQELTNNEIKLISNQIKAKKATIKNTNDVSKIFNASEKMTSKNIVDKAGVFDKALELGRKDKKEVKKIRVFDFDDTLAKSKSLVFYNRDNLTGKPTPKFKAIMMIGGPGSGKTNIGKGLELGREGWKVVNQDIFIEAEKKKAGLPEIEKDYTKEQRSQRAKIGAAGQKAAKSKLEQYTKAGEGMVIDGTGASYNATMKKVKALQDQGYEVFMVHAKTQPETALARNRARKERSLPDVIVERTQKSVTENIDKYKKDLGDKFLEIETETIEYGKPLPGEFVARVKQAVYATERGRLNAEEFAKDGTRLVEEGFVMDFSDFNIVREGERGPLFEVAEKIKAARGNEDLFVLTARAPESRDAIYEFLKAEGLEFKSDNIIGLGNSSPFAKSDWIVGKAAEGYNDFYFADDAIKNVKAVKDVLSQLDVKSKVQQAKMNMSEKLDKGINKIIEETKGISAEKEFSDIKAEIRGDKARRQRFFIPPSAEDFMGLIYPMLGKGKQGEQHMEFFKENLFDPYTRAMDNLSKDRVNLMNDFKALKKELDVPKDLRKETDSGFTREQAVRARIWTKLGEEIPGISKTDLKELNDIVEADPTLESFADNIIKITKGDGYSKPSNTWLAGTITTDLMEVLNKTKRPKYLEEWQQNVDQIFSSKNLNKMQAAFGPKYREALENTLARMKAGTNRIGGGNRLSNQVLDYINGAQGVVMFLNMRSALLQQLSAANFVNWSFNNPLNAGRAFANQPQYWKDFKTLMNSDYLVDRRNGQRINISENEIADAAKTSKNKAKGAINYILAKGYAPSQFMDSFAIASGGATWYRNRIRDLIKNKGMTEAQATETTMREFRQIAEKSQQSSDPSRISQQQSGDMGRIFLQWVNTPMQYARLQKRAIQDLVNRRGSDKENISKIIYYGFVQNMFFNALQQGLFALGFDDFGEAEIEDKTLNGINGMADSILRGLGISGITVSVLKNLGIDLLKRSERKRPEYGDAWMKLLEFSPAIKSKLSRIRSAAYPFDSKKRRQEVFDKGFSLDNPAYKSLAQVISAATNLPLDRAYSKTENIIAAFDSDTEAWQSIAMILGWPEWQLEPKEDKKLKSKSKETKSKKKKEKLDIIDAKAKVDAMGIVQVRNELKKRGLDYTSAGMRQRLTEALSK